MHQSWNTFTYLITVILLMQVPTPNIVLECTFSTDNDEN